jgi:UDP-N-acetylglucosamine--N-acetylmuramyl-(pentapeptide) pyrophosphoryl-undecaprenol N-acetylglucosamine transferase
MRLLVAGGGTGGHIYPGIAVAEEVRRLAPATVFLFVGSDRGLEGRVVPESGFELATVPARGVVRTRWWRLPGALLGNLTAFWRALGIVRRFAPDAVLATGGYVAFPVGLAAKSLHRPLVIQEQNSIPGLANRVLSLFADEVHLAFTEARGHLWRKDRLKLTGNPVRRVIFSASRREALQRFGLAEGVPTIFLFGGSRGARRITEAALDAMRRLSGVIRAQYILQTGRDDHAWARAEAERIASGIQVLPYITQIHDAYAAADLVICRAGAMTLAEIAACGVPSLLVPFPHAAYGHQERNALSLAERGAARVLLDRELTGERLAQEILQLLRDRDALHRMSAHARTFARRDAAERIARSLLGRAPAAEPPGLEAAAAPARPRRRRGA